jgi:hypothetical protein
MGVTVRRSFAQLPSVLAEAITRNDMYALGIQARERIIRRTQQGLDATNQPFAPYSEGYAKRKAEELGTGPVDLTVSGGMLNGIEIDATDTSVTLSFRG